jgi:DNA-binding transcriptional regulator YdaS (Cro superfamily)
MKLAKYLQTVDRQAFAASIGTTASYLPHLSGEFRKPSVKLALKIEKVTKGVVSRYDLRPDLFGRKAQAAA